MRWEVTKRFNGFIAPHLTAIQSVAVVGGGSQEPELQILKKRKDIDIRFFGIESDEDMSNFAHMDLNEPTTIVTQQFDLVLCSQVLEHLWDVKQAIANLVNLTNPGGYLWIACPASNIAHGSPDYFSAGYQPNLVVHLLNQHGVEILNQGVLGSERYYFLTHALQTWASRGGHRVPLLSNFSRRYPFQFLERLVATFKSSKISDLPKFATETYVLARVPN